MKAEERLELKALPKKFRPLSPFAYIFYFCLFCIPVVGDVLMIILSFKAKNVNLRRFAESFLAIVIIALVFLAALYLLGLISFSQFVEEYNKYQPAGDQKGEILAFLSAL